VLYKCTLDLRDAARRGAADHVQRSNLYIDGIKQCRMHLSGSESHGLAWDSLLSMMSPQFSYRFFICVNANGHRSHLHRMTGGLV